MQIEITHEYSISEIKAEFSKVFPFLKLEFFLKPRCPGQVSLMKFKISAQKKLSEYRLRKNNKTVIISPKMTLADLKHQLGNEFKIAVEVFQKCGGVWLETFLADQRTLSEQNKQGESVKSSFSTPAVN